MKIKKNQSLKMIENNIIYHKIFKTVKKNKKVV